MRCSTNGEACPAPWCVGKDRTLEQEQALRKGGLEPCLFLSRYAVLLESHPPKPAEAANILRQCLHAGAVKVKVLEAGEVAHPARQRSDRISRENEIRKGIPSFPSDSGRDVILFPDR